MLSWCLFHSFAGLTVDVPLQEQLWFAVHSDNDQLVLDPIYKQALCLSEQQLQTLLQGACDDTSALLLAVRCGAANAARG